MVNNLNGCSVRLKGGYPRRQLALVGPHKLIHEIFKTPLFAFVPDGSSTKNIQPRLAPYSLKKLSICEGRPVANTEDCEGSDEIDDPGDVPPRYQSWSASLTDVTPNTSSDDETSDEDSMFSLHAEESSSDDCSGIDHETNTMTSDVEDSCSLRYGDSEPDGLVVTTMETIELSESEIRVNIWHPDESTYPTRPTMSPAVNQCTSYDDIQTVFDSQLFEVSSDVSVRLPGAYVLNEEFVSSIDEIPRLVSKRSTCGDDPSPARLHRIGPSKIFEASDESHLNLFRHTCRTQGVAEFIPSYTSVPLQYLDPNICAESTNSMSYPLSPSSGYAHYHTQAPDSYSLWSAGIGSAYNNLYDMDVTSHMAVYHISPTDAINTQQTRTTPSSSQATTLLSILNASSTPYTPMSPRLTNGCISCLEDPPIVKLAPIGHPTARPTPSSYHWPRSEYSCGSTPNPSPLSSPPLNVHIHCEQAPPWPPVLSELHSQAVSQFP